MLGFFILVIKGCSVNRLWQDGKPLVKASSKLLLDGDWYFPAYRPNCGGTEGIYYKPTLGAPGKHKLHLANGTVVFSFLDGQNITVDGLAFEYSHNSVRAQSRSRPVQYIKLINNEFKNVEKSIFMESYTVDGIAFVNNHITISNNYFKNVRFAMLLNGSDINNNIITAHTATRHRDILISNNVVENMEYRYSVDDTSPDI